MSLIAQMVNVLQAMILTDGPRMILTPTYHVFRMHIPFQDSMFLPAEVESPDYAYGEFRFPALDVSAARGKDGRIHLSLVNRDPDSEVQVEVEVSGAGVTGASGQVLTGPELDSRNTFDDPDAVEPGALTVRTQRGRLAIELPPKSISVLALDE
jgi:alpha-N-arabinofuranosidase